MSRREYPAPTPLIESVPIDWYDFAQAEFTYGETEKDISEVWNLDGERFAVEVIEGIICTEDHPLQKQGVVEISYPEGYFDPISFIGTVENGRIWIGGIWYYYTDGLLDRPLDLEVLSDTPYLCFGSVYCYTYVDTQTLETPFPGTEWSVRPMSYIMPLAAAAYADLYGNTWYAPIPYPKTTTVTDTLDPVANGYDMREALPRMNYNRYAQRWDGTFPMAHEIANSRPYSIVRTKPLIARLKYNYRLEVDYV